MTGLSIFVAALNEERNLAAAITEIVRCADRTGLPYELLVFDDHSEDRTGAIAESVAAAYPRIRVFHNPNRLNIGGIYKAGVREASHEYCLLLPGDNEAEVAEVFRGLAYLSEADLAVSYTANQGIRPPLRRVLSRTYTWIVNLLFGTDFAYTNGSNICRTALLRGIHIETNGFAYQTEALVKLVRQGTSYVEFGINIRSRADGRSTALKLKNWVLVTRAIASLWWDVRVVNRSRYRRPGRKLRRVPPPGAS